MIVHLGWIRVLLFNAKKEVAIEFDPGELTRHQLIALARHGTPGSKGKAHFALPCDDEEMQKGLDGVKCILDRSYKKMENARRVGVIRTRLTFRSFKCLIDIYLPGTNVRHIQFWRVVDASEEQVKEAVSEAISDLPEEEVPYLPKVDIRCKHIVEGDTLEELKRAVRFRVIHAYRHQAATT